MRKQVRVTSMWKASHSSGLLKATEPSTNKTVFESLTMSIFRKSIVFYMVELQRKGDSTHHHFSQFILIAFLLQASYNFLSIQTAWPHFLSLTSDVCTAETEAYNRCPICDTSICSCTEMLWLALMRVRNKCVKFRCLKHREVPAAPEVLLLILCSPSTKTYYYY